MGLFDFVENFFFIGLALLFVLVLLLVYHFKQRMNSVEKKGDNMYDLLTNVVKELRNIRTNMIGGTAPVETKPSSVAVLPTIVEEEKIDDSDSDEDEESVYSEESDEIAEDGITYQIIDTYRNSSVAEKRVVVSDEDTDSDTDTETDSELETGSESESDDDQEDNTVPVETYTEDIPLETLDVAVEENNEVVYVENPIRGSFNNLNTIGLAEETTNEVVEEIPIETEDATTHHIPLDELSQNNTDDILPISRDNVDKSSLYKKMNVSQLRALAIQNGIQGDTSKLKKNALVDFLLEKQA